MTTSTLPINTRIRSQQTVRNAIQSAITLQATTAAICGSALKRWSIVW